MKIWNQLVLALVLATYAQGCAHYPQTSTITQPAANPSAQVSPLPTPSPIPGTPRVILKGTVNATPAEQTRIAAATTALNQTLASYCFKQWVLAAKYTETKGMTQAQVYAALSKEPVELTVEIFNGSFKENHIWHTIAYEGTGKQIRLNRYYLGSAKDIGSTMAHEGLGHGLGFEHYGVKSTSVPYGLNFATEGCP